jgi:UDP-N-acetylmuramoyl-tripeptide--D-alanyl-D-alanine ligase
MEIPELYRLFVECDYEISTDSRKIKPGCMFFALSGENFDGNVFASTALDAGARYAVVSSVSFGSDPRYIVVENVLDTFQKLSHYHRMQFSIPVVCIGGSNGKTTTKELITAVLSKKYRVLSTAGNYNNHIGVPLTLLGLRSHHTAAVIEVGANHPGEHAVLGPLVFPTHLVITNNGKDHLEGFGSTHGVRMANAELFKTAKDAESQVFLINDQTDLISDARDAQVALNVFGVENSYQILDGDEAGLKFSDGTEIHSHLIGDYNVSNILSAHAVGSVLGVDLSDIQSAIWEYHPSLNRSEKIMRDGVTYIMDCYNANPSSMELSIKSFLRTSNHPRALILGDMRELGEYAADEHQKIINLISDAQIDAVILIGEIFQKTKGRSDAHRFPDSESARAFVSETLKSGWSVLLKGSRGTAVEKSLDF